MGNIIIVSIFTFLTYQYGKYLVADIISMVNKQFLYIWKTSPKICKKIFFISRLFMIASISCFVICFLVKDTEYVLLVNILTVLVNVGAIEYLHLYKMSIMAELEVINRILKEKEQKDKENGK